MSHHRVELRNVFHRYPDGVDSIRDLSFVLTHGEAVAIVGANGAGKSTLIQLLNGSIFPTQGEVRIGDVPVTTQALPEIRRAVGTVLQDPDDQLFMPTVEEDVAFGPLQRGLASGEAMDRATHALDQVGALHLRDRAPYRLSAGEKRAVAIATVLSMTPDILVMDEPSSFLDPRGRRRLINLLLGFQHTRIIATHDLELAVEVCPRVLVLGEGRLVADGPTHHVLDDEALMLAHGLERPHILHHGHPHRS